MKYLVIGLGSMGKRRVRNLQALGVAEVAGFDIRLDRTSEAHQKYGIEVFNNFEDAIQKYSPNVFVISTSPDLHMLYAYAGGERGIHCFIEASVVDAEKIKKLHELVEGKNLVMAPSCTMRYFPGPKKIKELIQANAIGRILNINYETGQYLPDWHPWEKIEEFYVSKRETGAAREIVPFELTWLNDIFGDATPLACVKAKLTDMPADIDDIYHCLVRYDGNILANIAVDVIARPRAIREIRILGSEGEITYSADSNMVKYINLEMDEWSEFQLAIGTVESQYINAEEPYIAEMGDFIRAVNERNASLFPNSLMQDYNILKTLYALEDLSNN